MDNLFERINTLIDAQHGDATAFLGELVKVPSDTPPGNNVPAAECAAKWLDGMGYQVERHAVPQADVQKSGLQAVTNLVVRHRFGNGPTLALNAHGDVVPPGEGWSKPPYGAVVEQGRMYGRGVAVSKSDFATFTYALNALRTLQAEGLKLKGSVELHFTYDEEMGGEIGPAWLLSQKISRPDYVICAGFSYAIVTAHNGCLHLEITVHGKAAHAAQPDTGVDALRAANGILNALYALQPEFKKTKSKVTGIDSPTLNVGWIQGGTNTNVVPGKVVLKLDRRMIPEEDPAEVEAQLRAVIEAAAKPFAGTRLEIRRLLLAHALKPLPGNDKLVAPLQKFGAEVFGEPIPAMGTPLYTDARLYAEAGIPTVLYGAGPRTILESGAKRADENLVLEDLRRATKVLANSIAAILA